MLTQTVEAVVPRTVGNSKGLPVKNFHEARRIAARADIRLAIRIHAFQGIEKATVR